MSQKPASKSWEDRARLFLKAEIARADITYEELANRLKAHDINENAASIANKLARGTSPRPSFSRAWLPLASRTSLLATSDSPLGDDFLLGLRRLSLPAFRFDPESLHLNFSQGKRKRERQHERCNARSNIYPVNNLLN
jgi:hypothetical protein